MSLRFQFVAWMFTTCLVVAQPTTTQATQLVGADQQPPRLQQPSDAPVVFTERDPLSAIQEQMKRYNWQMSFIKKFDSAAGEYDLSKEKFRVYVPAAFNAETPHGLLVWISPTQSGEFPAAWRPVVDRHKLIVISADNAGNDRVYWCRIGLAIDAVFNMKKQYQLDEKRIFVTGFSGGARAASRAAMQYPEVFQGGLYMGACDYYRQLPVTGKPNAVWPAAFPAPSGKRLATMRKERRHVFLSGTDDMNYQPIKAMFEHSRDREKFAHVHFVETPGVGHVYPDAENFEEAIKALSEPSTD